MSKSDNRVWVRKTPLERLFGAKRVCYLIGGYRGSGNYGDVAQLVANLERLNLLTDGILPVPLIDLRHIESHEDLCREYPNLFGEGCFLYYTLPGSSAHQDHDAHERYDLIELNDPPTVYSQIIIYGGGLFRDRLDKEKLDAIEALQSWLRCAQVSNDESGLTAPLIILGQQIPEGFLSDAQYGRFVHLLERAHAVGVIDEPSMETTTKECSESISSKLFISGDDSASYLIAKSWRSDGAGGQRSASLDGGGSKPFTVNVHLGPAGYVGENPGRSSEIAVSIVRDIDELCGGNLVVNLIVEHGDRQSSETQYLDKLKATLTSKDGVVNTIKVISELRDGFPSFAESDLTVSCSYHVALTSLILSVPAILLYGDGCYRHQAQALKRAFQIPDGMILDTGEGTYKELRKHLKSAVSDHDFRAAACTHAAQGSAGMAANHVAAEAVLCEFLTSGYVAHLEQEYRSTSNRLLQTMEQLSDVQFDYAQLLNASLSVSSEAGATDATVHDAVLGKDVGYQQLMRRIREVVGSALPAESTVLVISKGDEELLKLDGRQAWHFPQTEEGTYAGHHPVNSNEAIGHLEVLRAKGADYLLFPNTAFWWLEHYKDFRRHLDTRYGRLWDDEHCVIYGLSDGGEGEVGAA